MVRVLTLVLLFTVGCSKTLRTDYGDFEPVGLFTLQEKVECVNYKVNTGVFIGTGMIYMMIEPPYAIGAGVWMAAFSLWEARSVDEQCFAEKGIVPKERPAEEVIAEEGQGDTQVEEPVIIKEEQEVEPMEEESYFEPYNTEEYVYED